MFSPCLSCRLGNEMNYFLVHIFQRHFEVKVIVFLNIKHNPGRSIRPNFGHIDPRGKAFPVKSKSISAKQAPG